MVYSTKGNCVWLTANELPNKELVTAEQFLLDRDAVQNSFFGHPGDNDNLHDGLVLERENFEADPPHRLRATFQQFG